MQNNLRTGLPHSDPDTTDAPLKEVVAALEGLTYKSIFPDGIFASQFLLKVSLGNMSIDIIGGFALRTSTGVYHVPTLITGDWNGIPVGSAEAWIKAYELLGRPAKAQMLSEAVLKNKTR